jgi:molecular chaperone IbpA
MNDFDFSPLFRSTIGFDRLTRLMDTATQLDTGASAYPPYNIEATGENAYRLTMAVAGFGAEDLEITAQRGVLVVTARALKDDEGYECILSRHRAAFRATPARRPHPGRGASLDNGLLHVDRARSARGTETAQDRDRDFATQPQVIEQKAA